MLYIWVIIFVVSTAIICLPFLYWLKDVIFIENMEFKTRTKVILSILAFILYTTLITLSFFNSSDESESVVSITEISEVYKSSVDSENSSYYYVSKDGDDKVYEIKVDKISEGDSNYVITRKYSNDSVENELVVKNKENLKELPNFNK